MSNTFTTFFFAGVIHTARLHRTIRQRGTFDIKFILLLVSAVTVYWINILYRVVKNLFLIKFNLSLKHIFEWKFKGSKGLFCAFILRRLHVIYLKTRKKKKERKFILNNIIEIEKNLRWCVYIKNLHPQLIGNIFGCSFREFSHFTDRNRNRTFFCLNIHAFDTWTRRV